MRAIKGRNTGPELTVRSYLHRHGLRFRLAAPTKLPCRPDIVFPTRKIVVFVHGCFWHQHPGCKHATSPKVNQPYWVPKLTRNVERDKQCTKTLLSMGWKVLTIWECEIGAARLKQLAKAILASYRPSTH